MSMLSAQIDELRAMAQLEKNLERPAIARILDDAADTILELRDDLQRANSSLQDAEHDESVAWDRVRKAETESAKLREELSKWERLAAGIELPEYPVTQFKPKDLERENAELRKLCADLYDHAAFSIGYFGDTYGILPRMRELGMEVDG